MALAETGLTSTSLYVLPNGSRHCDNRRMTTKSEHDCNAINLVKSGPLRNSFAQGKLRAIALLVTLALSGVLTQKLSAVQALAVASNGKWAMVYKPNFDADFNAVSAQAISECKAKGGTDPRIVWSQKSNIPITKGHANQGMARPSIAHGAIAISDGGTGTIVGWCFNKPYHNNKIAMDDCQKKGGQNPKVVARF
jgi:hypothetical protein